MLCTRGLARQPGTDSRMTSFVRKQQETGYAKYPNEDEVMAARDVLKPPGIMSNVSLEDFTPRDAPPHPAPYFS